MSEETANLNVKGETCLRRFLVCNNGSSNITLIEWSFFCEALTCDGSSIGGIDRSNLFICANRFKGIETGF